MKCEIPFAAVVRSDPMLCTRCAALSGCWMTHHMANATAAHVRTVFKFTPPPWKRRHLHFCEYPHNPSPKPGLDGAQAGAAPRPAVLSAAVCPVLTALRMPLESMPAPPGKYAACGGGLEGATPASVGGRAGRPVLWRIVPAMRACTHTFRFLDVPRSDNIPPCRACLGHGDA